MESPIFDSRLILIGESLFTSFASLAFVPLFPTEKLNAEIFFISKFEKLFWVRYSVLISFLRSVFKNILVFKNIRYSWVAKSLMSHTFAVKIRVFKHASHKIHLTYWTQIF